MKYNIVFKNHLLQAAASNSLRKNKQAKFTTIGTLPPPSWPWTCTKKQCYHPLTSQQWLLIFQYLYKYFLFLSKTKICTFNTLVIHLFYNKLCRNKKAIHIKFPFKKFIIHHLVSYN